MTVRTEISLTPQAARHVQKHLQQVENACGLRLGVRPSGCAGYQYVVELAKELQADDRIFESNGVKVIVNADSLAFLAGLELDYSRQGINEGFEFKNPNVSNSCGCGESFEIAQPESSRLVDSEE